MTFEQFTSRFEQKRVNGNNIMVRCPAHEDRQASLSIGRSRDGGVVLKCFAGCEARDIVKSLGLDLKDLFAEAGAR